MKKIPLTMNKFAIVDDDDYKYLSRFHWFALRSASGKFYAVRNLTKINEVGEVSKGQFLLYMHNILIMGGNARSIYHKNGDTLDNRKENLILLQRTVVNHYHEKYKNKSSKYKGVTLYKGRWRAEVTKNRKKYYLGSFETERLAADAYNKKAIELYGVLAYQNKL